MRKKLKDYLNQVVTLRGQIRYYEWYYRHHKAVYRYCIEKPTMNDEVVCEHMWVESRGRFKKGRWVEVSGEIIKYEKKNKGGNLTYNYGIGKTCSIHKIQGPSETPESTDQNKKSDHKNNPHPHTETNEGK